MRQIAILKQIKQCNFMKIVNIRLLQNKQVLKLNWTPRFFFCSLTYLKQKIGES